MRLHALLLTAGDDLFASSLLREPLPVRKAVAGLMFLERVEHGYPKTFSILHALKQAQ